MPATISKEALRRRITQVLRGSDEVKERAIALLSEPSTIEGLPHSDQLDILKSFDGYLRENLPPSVSALQQCDSTTDVPLVRCRCVYSILSAINTILSPRTGSASHQGIKDSLRGMWPHLWRWIREIFFLIRLIDEPLLLPMVVMQEIYPSPNGSKTIGTVLSACIGFVHIDPGYYNPNSMLHSLGHTPGFVRSIARLWISSVNDHSAASDLSIPTNYLMNDLLSVPDKPWTLEAESAVGSASEFVSAIFAHLCRLIPKRLYLVESVIGILASPLTQEIHQRLVTADSVPITIRMIEILSESEPVQGLTLQDTLRVSIQYLVQVFKRPYGQEEMQTAFKSKIIFSLATAARSKHLRTPDHNFVQICLRVLQILRPQLVFRSNLRAARKSFRAIQTTYQQFGWLDPSIDAAWKEFDAMTSALTLSEKTYLAGSGKECTTCSKKDTDVALRKCSNCGVYYCSKWCQMKDWKERSHREVCRPGLLRSRNRRFMTHLVCDLLHQCHENIALMYQRYVLLHDGDAPPVFHVEINCSAYPKTVGGWAFPPSSGHTPRIVPGDRTKCAKISVIIPTCGCETIKEDVPSAAKHFPEPAYYSRNEFFAQVMDEDDDADSILLEEVERIDATLTTAHLKSPTRYYWLNT